MIAIQVRALPEVLMLAKAIIPDYRTSIACKTIGGSHNNGNGFNAEYDQIFIFGKTQAVYEPLSKEYIAQAYRHRDSRGRYRAHSLYSDGREGCTYEWNGHTKEWTLTKENMQKLHDEGRIYYSASGIANKKVYLHESKGRKLNNFWADGFLGSSDSQRTGYPTQKALRVLCRLIQAGTCHGDICA